MKRAVILIITLTTLTFGCAWQLDRMQRRTALGYLDRLYTIRQLIMADELESAASEQAYLHALWQKDAHWLNALLDHHHTRDVESAMRHLSTALQEESRLHALLAMDDLADALEEAAQRDMAIWENMM